MPSINYTSTFLFSIFVSFFGFNQAGTIDASFATNGIRIDTLGIFGDRINSIAIQTDDKILAGGLSQTSFLASDFSLVRYTADGLRDSSFGIDGLVVTPIEQRSIGKSIVLQDDNKILLGGSSSLHINLARYQSNGDLDTTFGNNGVVITNISGFYGEECRSVAITPGGKIVIGVTASHFSSDIQHIILMRYLPNGDLDSTFATDGVAVLGEGQGNSIALQDDGKIIIAGRKDWKFHAVRCTADGIPDSSFGVNGKVTLGIGGTSGAHAIKWQGDGKIILGGYTSDNLIDKFALVRYNTDGTLDTSFGSNGQVVTPIGYSGTINSLIIQNDGKILSAGSAKENNSSSSSCFALSRHTTDGTLDSTFGLNGTRINPIYSSYSIGQSVGLQSDEKIILGGSVFSDTNTNLDLAIARFNNDESLSNMELFNESGIKNTFKVYPNPFHVSTNLEFETPSNNRTIRLTNLYGEPVRVIHGVKESNFTLIRDSLSPGVYFVTLIDETGASPPKRIVIL